VKRIIFFLAILSLTYSLFAQDRGIEFYLYNSENIRLLESSLGYRMNPARHTSLEIIGQSSWEERLNFNQQTRRSHLGSNFSYHKYRLIHSLSMGYESLYDASDLDPNAYVNKNGKIGYQLFWTPLDSLSMGVHTNLWIRNEQDRYLVGNLLKSDGLQVSTHASYRFDKEIVTASISAQTDHKEMDWEAYQDMAANAQMTWYLPNIFWDSRLNISHRQDEIYNLYHQLSKQLSTYQKQDTQKRNSFSIYSSMDYYPHELIALSLREHYSERRTRLSENIVRNNGEFLNELDFAVDYQAFPTLRLSTEAGHQLAIKDFSYAENTRHVENRRLGGSAAWEYSEQDSLIASLGITLQRTFFPRNDNRWDNDLRSRNIRLGWKHYPVNFVRLSNWFLYSLREDVYLDSLLSANNHDLRSISFLPEIGILLGDRVVLAQNYQIRTDYTDYHFDTDRAAKLYRQVGYRYHLIFDSYPYIARSMDDKWLSLPYRRNHGSAFLIDLGYSYEENQYATKQEDYYQIETKNRKYQASLMLKHDIGDFYYSLTHLYSWGTWTEYGLDFVANWSFDHGSWLELSISPISEDLRDIDWRSSINLNLRF